MRSYIQAGSNPASTLQFKTRSKPIRRVMKFTHRPRGTCKIYDTMRESITITQDSASTYEIRYPDGTTVGGLFEHQLSGWVADW